MPTLAVGMSEARDVATCPRQAWAWHLESAHITVFQELIAPTAARVAGALELAKSHLQSHIHAGATAPECGG